MAKIYARLIIKGAKKLSDVPDVMRAEVASILREWGYDADGSKIEK